MGARQSCRPLAQIAARKQVAIAKRPNSIEQEDVEVARQSYVLESIIEHDNAHTKALNGEHASSVTIPSHHHGDAGQMLCQEHRLVASDMGGHKTPLPIRDHGNGCPGSSTITTTQDGDA
jgi:hypothetical protein